VLGVLCVANSFRFVPAMCSVGGSAPSINEEAWNRTNSNASENRRDSTGRWRLVMKVHRESIVCEFHENIAIDVYVTPTSIFIYYVDRWKVSSRRTMQMPMSCEELYHAELEKNGCALLKSRPRLPSLQDHWVSLCTCTPLRTDPCHVLSIKNS
jgi:hypothetical protein